MRHTTLPRSRWRECRLLHGVAAACSANGSHSTSSYAPHLLACASEMSSPSRLFDKAMLLRTTSTPSGDQDPHRVIRAVAHDKYPLLLGSAAQTGSRESPLW